MSKHFMVQAKHLNEFDVLLYLREHGDNWSTSLTEICEKVWPGKPRKVVMAKMHGLVRRKLVSGCACGCRGDFNLTEVGEKCLVMRELFNGEERFRKYYSPT